MYMYMKVCVYIVCKYNDKLFMMHAQNCRATMQKIRHRIFTIHKCILECKAKPYTINRLTSSDSGCAEFNRLAVAAAKARAASSNPLPSPSVGLSAASIRTALASSVRLVDL